MRKDKMPDAGVRIDEKDVVWVRRDMLPQNLKGLRAAAMSDPDLVAAFRDAMGAHTRELRAELGGKAEELQARLQNVEQHVAMRGAQGGGQHGAGESPGAAMLKAFVDDTGLQKAMKAAQGNGQVPSLNARAEIVMPLRAITTGDGSSSEAGFPTAAERKSEIFIPGIKRTRLLDALPHRPTSSNAVEYIKVICEDEPSEQVNEGDAKAELDVSTILERATISTIAAWITASRQVLADNAQLQSTIDRLLRVKLAGKIESRLIGGDGTNGQIDGLLNQAYEYIPILSDNWADCIGEVAKSMEVAGFDASLVVLHPQDWFEIQTLKDGEGRYLLSVPTSPIAQALWNRQIVTCPRMTGGSALAIDTNYVTVLDREAVAVSMTNSHEDYFTRNLLAILGEARVGLEVVDEGAVYKFELPTSS